MRIWEQPKPTKASEPAAVAASKQFLNSMSAVLQQQELFLAKMQMEKQEWERERDSLRQEVNELKNQVVIEEEEEEEDNTAEETEIQGLKERLEALKNQFEETKETSQEFTRSNALTRTVSKRVRFEPKEVEVLRHELRDEHEGYIEELQEMRQELAEVKAAREEIKLLREELEQAKVPARQEIEALMTELTQMRQAEEQEYLYSEYEVKEEESLYSEYEVVTVSDAGSVCSVSSSEASTSSSSGCPDCCEASDDSSCTASMTSLPESVDGDAKISPAAAERKETPLRAVVRAPSSPVSVVQTTTTARTIAQDKKKKPVAPLLLPHTAETLSHAQRKDENLKAFLIDRRSLPYSHKSMSIQDAQTSSGGETLHLVMFENRWYIPASLQDATLEYLATQNDAEDVLLDRFIWPFCEAALMEYL